METVLRCYPDGLWLEKLAFVELAINEAKHASTGFAPYDLLYSTRKSPAETLLREPEDIETPEAMAMAKARLKEAMENIERAQEAQKRYYDRRHSTPPTLAAWDDVYLLLDLHPVRKLPKSKLAWPKWGPFKVSRMISPSAAEVDFPASSGIHRIVSIQHLEKLPVDTHDRPRQEATAVIDGEEAYDVERIIGKRLFGRRRYTQYLVKWKGFEDGQSEWLFEVDLMEDLDVDTMKRLVDEFEATQASVSFTSCPSRAEATHHYAPGKTMEKPILFLSRTLRQYEKGYTILELELGAVVWSILKCQRYLDGVPFTVVTDHQPILSVVNSTSKTITSPRVERWRMLLQPYMGQVTWVHKAGKTHTNVDALSRLTTETSSSRERVGAGVTPLRENGRKVFGTEEGRDAGPLRRKTREDCLDV